MSGTAMVTYRKYPRSSSAGPPVTHVIAENLRYVADNGFYYIKQGTRYTKKALCGLIHVLYTTHWSKEWERLWQTDNDMVMPPYDDYASHRQPTTLALVGSPALGPTSESSTTITLMDDFEDLSSMNENRYAAPEKKNIIPTGPRTL